jgi:hypothetical protein
MHFGDVARGVSSGIVGRKDSLSDLDVVELKDAKLLLEQLRA